jgi:hypothetical protein
MRPHDPVVAVGAGRSSDRIVDRRAFIVGSVAALAALPISEAQPQQPPPPPGLVCPDSTYWTGHGCTSGRRPPAEEQYVEIIRGKTTKSDVLALFGSPDKQSIDRDGNELTYDIHSLGPPYPTWFRDSSLRDDSGMLVFRFDPAGVFIGYHVTPGPSP